MIALVPARGGSKGLPGKNLKPLRGKPLIAHTIEAALATSSVDDVIVTTDDDEIARVAKAYGARVPFLRPPELARDGSSAVDVYLHAADFLMAERGEPLEKFMVLLPTTPLRTAGDIDAAFSLFEETGCTTLVSMREADNPPEWCFSRDEEGFAQPLDSTMLSKLSNRQDYKTWYVPNGAVYILDYQLLRQRRTYYCDKTMPYVMPRERSIDIDTAFDFMLAEYLMGSEMKARR